MRGSVSHVRFLRNMVLAGTSKPEGNPLLYGRLALATLHKVVASNK